MIGLSRREFAEYCLPPWAGFLLAAVSSFGCVGLEEVGFETDSERENRTDLQLSKGGSLREDIKKRLSFGHYQKVASTPPLILDTRVVTFVSAHFGHP